MKAKLQNRGLRAALAAVLGSLLMAAGIGAASKVPVAHAAQSSSQSNANSQQGQPERQLQAANTRQHGACGGGDTVGEMMAGWSEHGVLDDVARSSGQTPGLDGSSSAIVRKGVVKVIVVRGGWVKNFTCKNGTFEGPLSKQKYIPAGSVYFVPERLAPPPCKRKRAYLGWQGNCGNKQLGNLLVARPCAVKHRPKPHPKKPVKKVRIVIVKQAFSSALNEEQLIKPTPTNVFRFAVRCGLKGKTRFYVYQSDPQPAGTCSTKVARVLIWELSTLGPDRWESLNGTQVAKGKGPMGRLCPCAYQTFRLKHKKVVRAVFKDKQMRETPPPPPTTTTTTTTVVTTTTQTTTTPQPKSNVDLCLNISGEQTAVPAGYTRDSNGNCYPQTTTTTPQPKSDEDLCTNIGGTQTAIPAGYHRNSDGTCSPNSTTTTATTTTSSSTVDLCINIDGTQTQSDVDANYRKDPPDSGVPGNCYQK